LPSPYHRSDVVADADADAGANAGADADADASATSAQCVDRAVEQGNGRPKSCGFRGQPGRSCGPRWRSSCRLWPRPSTWTRVECAWSTAPSRRADPMPITTSCGAASTAPPGSTPNWSACSTAPPSTSPTRCRDAPTMGKAFRHTPVAEIVAHSGGGIVDKGAEASAMAKRLIVCCDGT